MIQKFINRNDASNLVILKYALKINIVRIDLLKLIKLLIAQKRSKMFN